jgi:REP element-mobilizing transposase RayT
MEPLAYHIIWTTYGTWLPGDARGWIAAGVWGIQAPDPERERQARALMAEDAVWLSPEQREIVEQAIRDHCGHARWMLQAVKVRTNHVHVVVTVDCDPRLARDQMKSWAARRLSDAAGLTTPVARKAGRRHWWTEGGDIETIWDDKYFENAVHYVAELQGD